ncbi:potassium channel family protein [Thalassorhabdus alkalitolerans]|uniref:Potassium channel family protein n=1 Tax=Thalassorhabdus alkalitolerans TaxID=2282697 RepID=A0ABW0YLR8_9BACI
MKRSSKPVYVILYEIFMVALAILSVSMIWIDNVYVPQIDLMVWLIFTIDVSVRFFKAGSKWEYVKKNPFDILAIVPFDSLFQMARIARLIRALRAVAIINYYARGLTAVLMTNNLHKVLTVTIMLIMFTAIPMPYIEPSIESYGDAVWWSIVTSTTVGYGDISPETGGGRMIALLLMLSGIGVIGMVTGSVATYFLSDKNKENPTVTHIVDQLSNYEELTADEVKRLGLLLTELEKEKSKSEQKVSDTH